MNQNLLLTLDLAPSIDASLAGLTAQPETGKPKSEPAARWQAKGKELREDMLSEVGSTGEVLDRKGKGKVNDTISTPPTMRKMLPDQFESEPTLPEEKGHDVSDNDPV